MREARAEKDDSHDKRRNQPQAGQRPVASDTVCLTSFELIMPLPLEGFGNPPSESGRDEIARGPFGPSRC
jgi:hypothetical protein